MADKDLTVHLKADDNITPVAKKAAAELKKLEKPIEVDADVSGVLSAFDQVAAEARATAAAAERLGQALGPELAAKADPGAIVGDLRQMGLTLDQITTNADQLGAKMRELSDADVGGKLGANLGTTRGKLDELNASAGSSRSVLANMVGNATQDVGALGGVAGSAGVAIGQMGEYMADAAANGDKLGTIVRNFGTVAGPIAAIAVGTQLISEAMASARASTQAHKDAVEGWTDAMKEGGDVTDVYVDSLRESGEIQGVVGDATLDSIGMMGSLLDKTAGLGKVIGEGAEMFGLFGDEVRSINPELAKAGISVERWAKVVAGGGDDLDKLRQGMKNAGVDTKTMDTVLTAATAAQKDHAVAVKADAEYTKIFGDETEVATDATKDYHRELAKTEAERATQQRVDKIKAMAAATIEAKEAMAEFNDTLASADWAAADVQGAAAGMSAWADQFFGIPARIAESEAAVDSFVEAIKENTLTFDLNTDAGRANQEQLEGVAKTLEDDFAQAYVDADGDMDTFKATAKGIADTTLTRLQTELGLSAEDTQTLATHLGLLPQDIETRYNLAGDAEARVKIGLLQSSINALPKSVQTEVNQQIIVGDYQGALRTIQNYYNNNPATVKVIPVAAALKGGAGAFAGIFSSTSSAAAPATATATTTAGATTYAPVAYAVPTVRVPVSVPSLTFNVGVIGNRFDSQRAITKALRAHQRLNGDRA